MARPTLWTNVAKYAQVAEAAGLGLVSIQERTRLIHGTVEIASRPNRGTTVTVKVPLEFACRPPAADSASA